LRREYNSSPVSSDQVIMHNTKSPSVLGLQLNVQQEVKIVRGSGTEMYGKEWAGCSADWYVAVGEDYCLWVFCVICLELEVFDCLNCEFGYSNLLRK